MDVQWLNDRESQAWRGLVMATQALNAQVERDLIADAGLSMADYAVLANLSEIDGRRLRATDLAERLSWSRSRLSHQVGRMETRGLVKRESCGEDARGSFVALTDEGYETIANAAPNHVASVRRHLFAALSPAEVDSLANVMIVIAAHLSANGSTADLG
jgi:DNA-binding MarR family transcriptional regulator